MARAGKLASRYARALLRATGEIAREAGAGQVPLDVAESLKGFAEVWKSDSNLSFYLLSPVYPRNERLSALVKVAEALGVNEIGRRFLEVIFERDRIAAAAEIIAAYCVLAEKQAGIVHVEIKTASQISDAERGDIESRLSAKVGGMPVFEWKVDPEILGGIVVMFDGKILDGSLSGRLGQLAEALA